METKYLHRLGTLFGLGLRTRNVMWVLYFLELVDLALLEFGVHRIVVFRYLNVVDKRSEIFGCPFA